MNIKRAYITEVTLITADEARRLPAQVLKGSCWWWTRSPGFFQAEPTVAYVNGSGMVMPAGTAVNDFNGAVRPVLVIGELIDVAGVKVGDEVSVEDIGPAVYIGNHKVLLGSVGYSRYDGRSAEFDGSAIKRWLKKWWDELPKRRRHG